MKTFNEIKEEIKDVKAQIVHLNETEDSIAAKFKSATPDECSALMEEFFSASKARKELELTLCFLKNNAKVVLFHEVIPTFVDVLMRYKGKQYGEKTAEKITKEAMEGTGASAYIVMPYKFLNNARVRIVKDGYDIDAITPEDKPILINNKIQDLSVDDFSLWYVKNEYIYDIPATIASMRDVYERAIKKHHELENLCSVFNSFVVDGISKLDAGKCFFNILFKQ